MSWISGRDAQYKTDVTEANRQLAAIRAADRAETKTLRNEKERLKWLLKSHIKNEARLLEQLQALKAKYGES
jgi:aminoglycoside phosphotransferase